MIRSLIFLACFLPQIVFAQDFPARFSVTGVAADDTLNIRSGPSSSTEILGELPPFAINVEVLRTSDDGKWGLIGTGEGNGWVFMRFLKESPPHDPNTIPRPLICSGTEPFWTLAMHARGAEFNELGGSREDLNEGFEGVADAGYLAEFDQGPYISYVLMAERAQCGDGMSDREFGFTARLFVETPDGNRFLRGCCTMDAGR